MSGYLRREAARFIDRCVYSIEGVVISWREEPSFPQWAIANVISAALTFAVEMTAAERALIIGFGLMILVAELLNTGIESAIDRVGAERHPLSKKAKDCGCAAVALAAITAGLIWVIVLVG